MIKLGSPIVVYRLQGLWRIGRCLVEAKSYRFCVTFINYMSSIGHWRKKGLETRVLPFDYFPKLYFHVMVSACELGRLAILKAYVAIVKDSTVRERVTIFLYINSLAQNLIVKLTAVSN